MTWEWYGWVAEHGDGYCKFPFVLLPKINRNDNCEAITPPRLLGTYVIH